MEQIKAGGQSRPPQTVEKGEIRARRSCAASSVTGVSDTGATFPKGEGTGEKVRHYLTNYARAFPETGKVSAAIAADG